MLKNIKHEMQSFLAQSAATELFRFADISLDVARIKTVMINEVVPPDAGDDFYGGNEPPAYLTTTLPLFQKAGFPAQTIADLTAAGIYLTNAIKLPKTETTIPPDVIEKHVPLLEYELSLFPGLMVVMLMGDVAKKTFNTIAKRKTGNIAVPAVSTYKLRDRDIYFDRLRIFPSYIMTGGNILIEKSKVEMAAGDIRKMLEIIR